MELGIPRTTFRRIRKRLRWRRMSAGTFLTTGLKPTWRQRLRAAIKAAGPDAVVAGASAAVLMRWDGFEEKTLVIAVPAKQRPRLEGVTVHRTRELLADETWLIDGFRVTTPARTLADLALTAPEDVLVTAINAFARRKGNQALFKLRTDLTKMVGRNLERLLELLEERIRKFAGPEPGLETRLARVLREAGYRPQPQHELRDHGRLIKRFDFALKDHKIAIEADSERWHSDPDAKAHDLEQRARVRQLGWDIVVAKDADTYQPAEFLAELARKIVERPARSLGPNPTEQLGLFDPKPDPITIPPPLPELVYGRVVMRNGELVADRQDNDALARSLGILPTDVL